MLLISRFDSLTSFLKLGISNIVRVCLYRFLVRIGYYKRVMPIREPVVGPFFCEVQHKYPKDDELLTKWKSYSLYDMNLKEIPKWHVGFLSGTNFVSDRHWTEINEFASTDVKDVWELSRFDWIFPLIFSNQVGVLNRWIDDWSHCNPCNQGINWKCAQEVSIRVIHLVLALVLLKQQSKPLKSLKDLIQEHIERVVPTMMYATAQCNNHSTSEATACYLGGLVLNSPKYERLGRKALERLVSKLVLPDGTFVQYSVNYHRLFLDTISIVELVRRIYGRDQFSTNFYSKMRLATDWLFSFTDAMSGDAPNMGANDGACLLRLVNTVYRDYRPSVQLASALFYNGVAYHGMSVLDKLLSLFDLHPRNDLSPRRQDFFPYGGYQVVRGGRATVFFRTPRYKRFRPSHCDALHIDLWIDGKPFLHDDGSYRYNTKGAESLCAYGTTQMHNTIQMDDHEQMPKIGRFLLGSWINCDIKNGYASYTDYLGCSHSRFLKLEENQLVIVDNISGIRKGSVARWHFKKGANIQIISSPKGKECATKESLLYTQEIDTNVYEITLKKGEEHLTTIIKWK